MRIVITRSNAICPDSRVEKEANSLIKMGHSVTILGWDRSSNHKCKKDKIKLLNGEADIYRFGVKAVFGGGIKKNLIPMFRIQNQMYKWLKKNRNNYDVIHACDFDNGLTAYKMNKRYHKKYVYDIFDYYIASHDIPKFLSNIIEKKDFKVINKAECTIICSEQRLEQIKGSKPKMISIIENSPDPNLLNDLTQFKLKSNNDKIKIAYVGILSRARLIIDMLDVVSKNKDFELHIAGFGQLHDEIISYSNSFANIYYYGKIPYESTLQLEKQCDIMTAIYDPTVANHKFAAPNKFYEAMMLGKPLIMVKNTGMDKIVSDNCFGRVIEFNAEGFENAIIEIKNEKESWSEISERMKKMFEEKYSWNIMEEELRKIYESIKE